MSQFRFARLGLIVAALGLNLAPSAVGLSSVAYAADTKGETLRPEVGKLLQSATELMKAQKYKDALAKVREADAISGKTPFETYTTDRMRGALAIAVGDTDTAARSFEASIATGRVSEADQVKFAQALAGAYYRAKDYSKSIVWLNRYFKEGGTDPQMRPLLVQAYYLSGDYGRAAKEVLADVQAEEKAGRTPSEDTLLMLADCENRQKNQVGYVAAVEKLATYHPKKEYWNDLLSRTLTKPGFSERLNLDVYRLKLAAGQLKTENEFSEMAQLALQAGFPAEAKKVVDLAYQTKVFGVGPEAARQKRLQALADKSAADDLKTMAQGEADAAKAKDGTGLINLGYAYVTTGQFDKGVALMEQGFAKGGLKRPEDAKLHMGIAYHLAGQKAKAFQTFHTVQGTDGSADLARYWLMLVNHPIN